MSASPQSATYDIPPHNIEAEQTLLGCLLSYPDLIGSIGSFLRPEHFFENIHARVYDAILQLANSGSLASPLTLKIHFEKDDTLREIGGWNYLVRLISATGPRIGADAYARQIQHLADRRQVMAACDEMRANAASMGDFDGTRFRAALANHISEATSVFDTSRSRKTTYTASEASWDALQRLNRLHAGASDPSAIPTGLSELDRMTGGMRRGELIIVGARPSMGKTALGVQIASNIARRGGGVVFFSLEMPVALLMPRLIAERLWTPGCSSPSYQAILNGRVSENELRWASDVVGEIKSWPLLIDDDAGLTATELEARARVLASRLKAKNVALDAVIVDHLHKMRCPGAASRVAEFSEISAGLAEAAKRLDVPMLCLAQLNRAVEGRDEKRPTLGDLRESGSIEQDAGTVWFPFREGYYTERARCRSVADEAGRLADLHRQSHKLEIIIAKQRSGPIGTVLLWADMASNVIRDTSEAA